MNFPIVGIGASAGGLAAFKKLLESIEPNSGMAYVLVQHLAPSHDSLLPELLEKHTSLPIYEITDEINLAPDHIYIIPENQVLTTQDGILKLRQRDADNKKNLPVDIFFKSLAEVHKSFAIAVVLSGSGMDGSEGVKWIKELGGITYAQSPDSASFDGMPQNAINSGAVDFILAPEDIPQHLLHIKKAYKTNHAYSDESRLPQDEEEIFKQILRLLRLRSGNDFSHYKQPTLRRRIARRMVTTKMEQPIQYLKYLRENKDEQDTLFNDVLIPVSYFFRDTKTFDLLPEAVFPLLLKNKGQNDSLRLWVAGCSTGEEAYSLAICLHEYLSDKAPGMKVQIFASDISEKVIVKARTAIYGKEETQNISEDRLNRYFTKTDGSYHINKVIRDMCIFAVHNFLKDPPFAKIDMISCRNVMIYFDPFLQKKAMTTFHYALKQNGIVFLGKSESVSSVTNLFEPLIKNHKIFVRKTTPPHYVPVLFEPQEQSLPVQKSQSPVIPKKLPQGEQDIHKIANHILFTKFTPAGVIINEQKDIIHFHGDTSPFLLLSPGKPNLNILKMAREGLAFELRNALLKVKANEEVSKVGIPLKGKDYGVNFNVIPLKNNTEPHTLVLFSKYDNSDRNDSDANRNESDLQRISLLEAELDQLREDIRSVTEDQEAVNEELQSANEELLSNSEELQSLNEELETSAEELQSNNEELISVNDELMDRQDQLISARSYAEAIVETIREPLVILDTRLRIKSANSAFYKFFQTNEHITEGLSIFELNNGQWHNPELRPLLETILPNKTKIEDFEISALFPGVGQRSILVNARQVVNERFSEQLILMAFEDITEKKISKILRDSEEHFRIMANTAPVLLWISDADKQATFFNKSWLDYTGRTFDQEKDNGWAENIFPEDYETVIENYNKFFDARAEFTMEYRLKRHDGEYRWISVKGAPRITPDGQFTGYVGGCMDIHEQKNFSEMLEEKVEQRTKELRDSESFLQSLLNTTQNLIYLYDFEKEKLVFINKRAFEATGFTSEEIENADIDIFTPLIHADDLPALRAQRHQIRELSDGELATVEFRLRNRNGEWTCQLSRDLVFKRDAKNNVLQYIGVATDITDLKNANEQMIVKNQELEHSNSELASFSSIASHDLKEPLRKIQIFSKLVIAKDKNNVSEDSLGFLERVVVSANRMQQLIDDLISYSRTSSQKIVYTETDLNLLLNEVLEDLKEVIAEANAKVIIEEMPFVPVIPSQFRQLFLNLISNAIKYSRAGILPQIEIKSQKATEAEIITLGGDLETSFLKISVIDNGIGFADEYSTRIFEPFQRLHGKDEYSGTGIGLAICKKIMINHNGFIVAQSEEGRGASFYIYVPDGK